MNRNFRSVTVAALAAMALYAIESEWRLAFAQDQQAAATSEEQAPTPLTEEELEVLVARIALYPDELVAVISASSLFPLQVVEASRFLDDVKKNPALKPKSTWDGSVISLLNYPEIVKMMSDDLDWTQALGEALSHQQKDVLAAIQQLRAKAVADGIIKTDDKVKVVEENEKVIIQPVSQETVYVPQYEPQMLYEPDYVPAPVTYYPQPYPSYYYPAAPYFAGFVTGAVWGAVVDWDDWGVWGGRWDNDIDIDCNHCFNNVDIDGKIKWNDVDWKNVDRNKINIDKNQFNKIDRNSFKNSVKANDRNSIRNQATNLKKTRTANLPGKSNQVKDVRKSTVEGLKSKPAARKPVSKPSATRTSSVQPSGGKRPAKVDRPVGKPKPAAKRDNRPSKPSGLGEVRRGSETKIHSNRGQKSMGGGARGGGGHKKQIKRGGGRRR